MNLETRKKLLKAAELLQEVEREITNEVEQSLKSDGPSARTNLMSLSVELGSLGAINEVLGGV